MTKSTRDPNADPRPETSEPEPPPGSSLRQSAHQVWLAGLSVFSKAQQEGGKAFEAGTAQMLQRLGVPTAQDLADLRAQVAALTEQVQALQQPPRPARPRSTARPAAKRAPRTPRAVPPLSDKNEDGSPGSTD